MPDAASNASSLRREKQTTAIFMPKTDENGRVLTDARQRQNKVTVHFNPDSLDITFTNSIQPGRRNQPAQVSVTETTAKLGMELIFDTTLSGIDVRTETNKLARMMDPAQQTPRRGNNSGKIPSIVIFQWGTIWFEGYIDTYREKVDFFSSEGVPLRATVTLSMTQQQRNFQPNTSAGFENNVGAAGLSPGSNASINPIGSARSMTDALKSGNPSAGGSSAFARIVAAANGIENIRLPEVNEFVIPNIQPPQTPRFGLSLSATGNGLNVQAKGGTEELFSNLKKAGGLSVSAGLSSDIESQFNRGSGMETEVFSGLGGSMQVGSNSSMSADVGLSADIEPGIRFEER